MMFVAALASSRFFISSSFWSCLFFKMIYCCSFSCCVLSLLAVVLIIVFGADIVFVVGGFCNVVSLCKQSTPARLYTTPRHTNGSTKVFPRQRKIRSPQKPSLLRYAREVLRY